MLHRRGRRGLGRSYVNAFRRVLASDADLVCQMDADLSHAPSYGRCRRRGHRERFLHRDARRLFGGFGRGDYYALECREPLVDFREALLDCSHPIVEPLVVLAHGSPASAAATSSQVA